MTYRYDFTNGKCPGMFWMAQERISQMFSNPLSDTMADVLDVASAIYAADRQSLRSYGEAETGQRSIVVKIPVRIPELWASEKVATRLQSTLLWMSGDLWEFEFVKRKESSDLINRELFLFGLGYDRPVAVSMFSGGLDSLAGLASHMESESAGTRILVSGYTNERLGSQQRLQVQHIRRAMQKRSENDGLTIWRASVPFGIRSHGERLREEKSQRTRALVFLALGAAVAMQSRTDTLWVYENGIGALNLPMSAVQLGVDNYRGVHPKSLRMVQELFQILLEKDFRIKNRCLFDTKAEMCDSLRRIELADLAAYTVSCDGYPQRVKGTTQCGRCTSCVLRRQSLHSSGLSRFDAPSGYRVDLFGDHAVLTSEDTFGFQAMQGQVHKFKRCLSADAPWSSLSASFPELVRTHMEIGGHENMNFERVREKLVRLIQTYVSEWEPFAAIIDQDGARRAAA